MGCLLVSLAEGCGGGVDDIRVGSAGAAGEGVGAGLFALLRMAPFMAIIKLTLPAPLMSFFMYIFPQFPLFSLFFFYFSPSSPSFHFLPAQTVAYQNRNYNLIFLFLSLFLSFFSRIIVSRRYFYGLSFNVSAPSPPPFDASAGVNLFIILFGLPSHSRLSENLIIAFSPVALAFAAAFLLFPLLFLIILPLLLCFFFSVRSFCFQFN